MERKEAIEVVKKNWPDSGFTMLCEALETLVPELKESEGEKILRHLKAVVKEYDMWTERGLSMNDVLTWLEKQDEQKPDTDFLDLRTWKYIVDAVLTEKEGIGQYLDSPFTEEVAKKLQKRFGNIEQKPVKVPKFKVGDFIQFNGMGHTRYTIKEVCGLSHYINTCNKRMDMSYTDANFELVEQKPAAWSEGDEENSKNILYILNQLKGNAIYNKDKIAEKCIDWLKSLKDRIQHQPTWKPSIAQLNALSIVSKGNAPDDIEAIVSLYNDLEKLREK